MLLLLLTTGACENSKPKPVEPATAKPPSDPAKPPTKVDVPTPAPAPAPGPAPAADTWKEYTLEDTVVLAPVAPDKHNIDIPGPTGPVPSNQYFFTPSPSGMLAASMFTMPQVPGQKPDYKEALIGGRDGMVTTYGGKLLTDKEVTIEGAQGRDFTFDGGDEEVGPVKGRAVILVRGAKVYQLFYLHSADAVTFPAIGDRFLSSFKFAAAP